MARRRLKRGTFNSLVELQAAINRFVTHHNNDNPKPFRWTADPEKIIAAVRRGHQALDSHHYDVVRWYVSAPTQVADPMSRHPAQRFHVDHLVSLAFP